MFVVLMCGSNCEFMFDMWWYPIFSLNCGSLKMLLHSSVVSACYLLNNFRCFVTGRKCCISSPRKCRLFSHTSNNTLKLEGIWRRACVILTVQVDYKGFWRWCIILRSTGVFGLWPSSSILEIRKHTVSETGSVSVLRWGRKTPAQWVL
jgi:hypothetical protein